MIFMRSEQWHSTLFLVKSNFMKLNNDHENHAIYDENASSGQNCSKDYYAVHDTYEPI